MNEPVVVHLNDALTWRGGERQVLNLMAALAERGIRQLLVARHGSEIAKRGLSEGLDVREVPMRSELDLLAPRRIAAIARGIGANVIHAHTSGAHGLGLRVVKRLRSAKLIVSRRVDFPVARDFFSRRKYLNSRVAAYIGVSLRVGEVLEESGIARDRIRVVHSAIDPKRYVDVEEPDSLRTEFAVRSGELILGNVAALVDHKDQRTLLEAIALLPAAGTDGRFGKLPPYRLLILGEGELRGALERRSRELGLEQLGTVIFTGFRTDVLSFYKLFSVFVMSSKEEGLGTAVLDALHFGLPVAATAGGGLPEMIDHRQGGLLSPVGDPQALADSLEELLAKADLRASMAAYNRKKATLFSMDQVVAGTLATYREVLR